MESKLINIFHGNRLKIPANSFHYIDLTSTDVYILSWTMTVLTTWFTSNFKSAKVYIGVTTQSDRFVRNGEDLCIDQILGKHKNEAKKYNLHFWV